MPHERFRPHQAHYLNDMQHEELRGRPMGRSVEGVSWTRDHPSNSRLKLPSLTTKSTTATYSSTGRRVQQSISLPMVGPYASSPSNTSGSCASFPGTVSHAQSTSHIIGHHSNATGSSTDKSTSDWRKDAALRDWAAKVDMRKVKLESSKIHAANKEASWILQRREKQMREIQKRTKATQEAENKARRQQEHREREEAARLRQDARVITKKENVADGAEVTQQPLRNSLEKPLRNSLQTDANVGDGLQWQEPPPMLHIQRAGTATAAVWVKAGHFTTKVIAE